MYSDENDLICDPFIGSGTTDEVSKECKRNCIGYEISTEICKGLKEKNLSIVF